MLIYGDKVSPVGRISSATLILSATLFLIPAIGSNKNTCSTLGPKYGVTSKLKLLSEANEEVATPDPVTLGCIEAEPVYNSPPKEALNAN